MDKNYNLCMKCMNELDENGVCPKCGYLAETPCLPFCLKPHTVIDDRYILGNVTSYNGESITYIGFDTTLETKVYVREFMPQNFCRRVKSEPKFEVRPENIVKFKNCLAEFAELNKSLMKMKSLSHIISVNDVLYENGTVYSVCDYYEGMTFREYLSRKGEILSWDELRTLLPPILTTLGLLHNAGLNHLGISPDTIVLTKKGDLKISGFSTLDERISDSVLAPELFPGYSAPEQYHNDMKIGEWCDVYSICAVIYRALTGIEPPESIIRTVNDDLVEIEDMKIPVPQKIAEAIDDGLCLDEKYRIMSINDLVPRLFETTATINIKKIREEEEKTRVMSKADVRALENSGNKNDKNDNKDNKSFFQKYKLQILIISISAFVMAIIIVILVLVIGAKKGDDKATDKYVTSDTSRTTQMTTKKEETTTEEAPEDFLEIPNFKNSSYDSISNRDDFKGYVVFKPDYQYKDDVPNGTVFEQSVKEGTKVKKGQKLQITLGVSKGKQYIDFPNYVDNNDNHYDYDQYKKILNSVGIDKVERGGERESDYNKGDVCGVSVDINTKYDLKKSDTVYVYISKGKKPAETEKGTHSGN